MTGKGGNAGWFKKGHTSWLKGKKNNSPSCFKKGHIPWCAGEHLSEEHKGKISEANKGREMSKEWREKIGKANKGRTVWNKGKPRTEETKEKISKAIRGRKLSKEWREKIGEAEKGKKNWNWQGGISFEPYGLEFNKELKRQIRKRDNYTCQECRMTEEELGYRLACHHIDYDKRNNNTNNLISLCRSCHTQTNYGREDWTEYYQNKLL